jgi:hypothetical protein
MLPLYKITAALVAADNTQGPQIAFYVSKIYCMIMETNKMYAGFFVVANSTFTVTVPNKPP